MKTKTNELIGEALNWAVAKAEAMHVSVSRGGWVVFDSDAFSEFRNDYNDDKLQKFSPSTNWAQGGKIIERECIAISCIHTTGYTPDTWTAHHPQRVWARGSTPLIAAMRAYVAAKLGDEVEVHDDVR